MNDSQNLINERFHNNQKTELADEFLRITDQLKDRLDVQEERTGELLQRIAKIYNDVDNMVDRKLSDLVSKIETLEATVENLETRMRRGDQ